MKNNSAEIGVFGGSGFYNLLENTKEIKIKTPYGWPSDKITIGTFSGKKVAFLPRHGKNHQYPPHKIPYLANLYAFKKLGVKRIIAPCAVGSLNPKIKPGDFVICDQFVDRTKSRKDTFFGGPKVVHISTAHPYCGQMRDLAVKCAKKLKIKFHPRGTAVTINGPRFSTAAESQWFQKMGWQVIGMTQYPEVSLAREMEICYVNISLITDYDAGLAGRKDIKPVSANEVVKVFNKNNEKVKKLIFEMMKNMPSNFSCQCQSALKGAQISS